MTLPLSFLLAVVLVTAPSYGDGADDRAGVTPGTLTIGLHLAMTGGEALPPGIGQGARMYWRYLHDDLGVLVHGRRIEVQLRNDEGTPTTAVAVCNDLAQGAFVVAGLSGAEQIQACAEYAAPRGVPYLTIGGPSLPAYATTAYAVSAAIAPQARTMAAYIVSLGTSADRYGPWRLPVLGIPTPVPIDELNEPDGEVRVGLVRSNTPGSDESEDALRAELRARGRDLDRVYTVVRSGSGDEAASVARRARQDLIDVLVTETGVPFTQQLVLNADQNGYAPRFVSYGVTSGTDGFVQAVCGRTGAASALHGASTFSPWPAWSDVRDGAFDAHVAPAAAAYAPDVPGDLLVAGWGLMKIVHRVIEAAGDDPSRSALLATLGTGFSATTGVYPPVAVDAADHEGGEQMHRLEADCAARTPGFVTREAFLGVD